MSDPLDPHTDACTTESLFQGAMRIRQYKQGYRYAIDPVLLAHFVRPADDHSVIDLGTGSGIIPLILAHRFPGIMITGIEIQKSLADLAKENILINGLNDRVTIIHSDMSELMGSIPGTQADLVLSNPPFIRKKAGRINPLSEKALARHEIAITLPRLIRTASDLLKRGGRFAVIYPHNRLADLVSGLENERFQPIRLRMVHPLSGGPARRVLVESVKDGCGSLVVGPPLEIFTDRGVYSDEVSSMFV